MSTMTLEQISFVLRDLAQGPNHFGYTSGISSAQWKNFAKELMGVLPSFADAIDDHLAAREADAVPVAFRIVDRHGPYPWVDASLLKPGEKPETITGEDERVEYAYAAPVAQEAAAPAIFGTPEDGAVQRSIREGFRPAFDYPKTAAEAVAVLDACSDELTLTFDHIKSKHCADALRSVVASYGRVAGLQLPVATPDLSDRYRAVMEAQGGVTDLGAWDEAHAERIRPAFEKWAESKNLNLSRPISSTHDDGYFSGATYWAFRAWAFAALAAHPHTGHSAVPEGESHEAE